MGKELITVVAARALRSPENGHFAMNSPRKWPSESVFVHFLLDDGASRNALTRGFASSRPMWRFG